MKNIIRKYIVCIAAALCMFSCSEFEDMSRNPYALYDAPAESYVQPILYQTEYALVQRALDVMAELMQYSVNRATEITSQMNYNYSITESHVAFIWQNLYLQAGNAERMLETARREENPAMEGVALVLKTMIMSVITDTYGNVPYTDACKLSLSEGEISYRTTYDRQEDIYIDLLRSLELANKAFEEAKTAVGSGTISDNNFSAICDYMYNGDADKWQRFGNSLYLRLLMRCSLKVEENGGILNLGEDLGDLSVRNKIAELYDNYVSGSGSYPMMRDGNDAALVGFSTTNSALYTPFFNITSGNWNSYVACQTLTDFEDPRWSYYFTRAYGVPPQLFLNDLNEYIDGVFDDEGQLVTEGHRVGNYPRGAGAQVGNLKNADHYALMNFSEQLFIFAEAAYRGWIGGADVKSLYLEAVEESILEWNKKIPGQTSMYEEDGETLTDYGKMDRFIKHLSDQYDIDYATRLDKIMTQKWVSLFFVGIESWCDYRRTGFPVLKTNGPAAENNQILPTRMRYPADEKYRNEKSYNAALADWLGGENNMQTDVWWADNAESRERRLEGRRK